MTSFAYENEASYKKIRIYGLLVKKITPEVAVELGKRINRETYFVNPFWLAENCYWEDGNGEPIIYVYDWIDKTKHQLFAPQRKENIKKHLELITQEDLQRVRKMSIELEEVILIEEEYFYKTKDLIEMKGKQFATFRKRVHKFQKTYKYSLSHSYPAEKITAFIKKWASTKDLKKYGPEAKTIFEWDLDNCLNYVKLLDKLPCKNLFVEIDGKLAGFAITCPLYPDLFVALMQKTDIQYQGLSRFLYHEKAKLYPDTAFFTVGTSALAPGLETFKEELRPVRKEALYFAVLTKL